MSFEVFGEGFIVVSEALFPVACDKIFEDLIFLGIGQYYEMFFGSLEQSGLFSFGDVLFYFIG